MLIDTHIHTKEFSADAKLSFNEIIKYASDNPSAILCATEHYDYDYPATDRQLIFDPDAYYEKYTKIKVQYENLTGKKFPVLFGIECGYMEHLGPYFDSFARLYPFDSIICSAHYFDGFDPFFDRQVYELGKNHVYSRYLETIIHSLENYSDFDIVGHYDYICRYAPYDDRKLYYKDFPDHFDRIFSLCIENKKALELNTRTSAVFLSDKVSDYLFDPAILLRYKEMGGELVSFGSDAHQLDSIMSLFDETKKLLAETGFTGIVYYEKRSHVYVPL
ncbi:MAG: histidinol-phosphatase HisJ family protein [Saccharofermentanales bacterium]